MDSAMQLVRSGKETDPEGRTNRPMVQPAARRTGQRRASLAVGGRIDRAVPQSSPCLAARCGGYAALFDGPTVKPPHPFKQFPLQSYPPSRCYPKRGATGTQTVRNRFSCVLQGEREFDALRPARQCGGIGRISAERHLKRDQGNCVHCLWYRGET